MKFEFCLFAEIALNSDQQFQKRGLAKLPRLFIDCNRPPYPTIDAMRARVRELPGWQVAEIATGHCPMVTQPEVLVQHLLDFCDR